MQPLLQTQLPESSLHSQMVHPITALTKSMGVHRLPTTRSAVCELCREERKSMYTSQEKDHGENTFTFSKQHKETTLRQSVLYFAEHNAPHSLGQRAGTAPPPLPTCLRVSVSHLASSYQLVINSLGKFSGLAGFTC